MSHQSASSTSSSLSDLTTTLYNNIISDANLSQNKSELSCLRSWSQPAVYAGKQQVERPYNEVCCDMFEGHAPNFKPLYCFLIILNTYIKAPSI